MVLRKTKRAHHFPQPLRKQPKKTLEVAPCTHVYMCLPFLNQVQFRWQHTTRSPLFLTRAIKTPDLKKKWFRRVSFQQPPSTACRKMSPALYIQLYPQKCDVGCAATVAVLKALFFHPFVSNNHTYVPCMGSTLLCLRRYFRLYVSPSSPFRIAWAVYTRNNMQPLPPLPLPSPSHPLPLTLRDWASYVAGC